MLLKFELLGDKFYWVVWFVWGMGVVLLVFVLGLGVVIVYCYGFEN